MHICIYIKGHLVKRKGCIRRNDFVKQGRVELLLRKINTEESY